MLLPTGSSLRVGPDSDENLPFLIVWIVVMALVVVLFVLAAIDSIATRSYARRHRQQIVLESIESARRRGRESVEEQRGRDESPGAIHPDPTKDGNRPHQFERWR
jgi:hypothetical protein